MEENKPSVLGQLPQFQPVTGKDPSLVMQALYPGGSKHLMCTEGAWVATAEQGKLGTHHLPACKSLQQVLDLGVHAQSWDLGSCGHAATQLLLHIGQIPTGSPHLAT